MNGKLKLQRLVLCWLIAIVAGCSSNPSGDGQTVASPPAAETPIVAPATRVAPAAGAVPQTQAAPQSAPSEAPATRSTGGTAPAQLTVTAQPSDTVVRLAWQAVGGANGYFVYRDNNPVPLNPKPIPLTTYEDLGLTNGRTYTYTVAALDQAGKPSVQSAPVVVKPGQP